jgi:hypothetical protein
LSGLSRIKGLIKTKQLIYTPIGENKVIPIFYLLLSYFTTPTVNSLKKARHRARKFKEKLNGSYL